jgi:hypothetical protein
METRVMTMTEIKNKHLGNGLRRIRYEERLERLKHKSPYEVGENMGLSMDLSIMFQEYMEAQLDSFVKNVFISSN